MTEYEIAINNLNEQAKAEALRDELFAAQLKVWNIQAPFDREINEAKTSWQQVLSQMEENAK